LGQGRVPGHPSGRTEARINRAADKAAAGTWPGGTMMRIRPGKLFLATALLPAVAAGQDHGALDDSLVQEYCFGCHNSQDWAGSLALDVLDTGHIPGDAEIWELVLRKLEAGMMPPTGEPRPSPDEVDAFTREVIARLDAPHYPPAGPALHRLNRNEYANAIRDLLD